MSVLLIECRVPPFTVPHFLIDGSPTQLEFPTKLDYLIADLDGDGIITQGDVDNASDELLVMNRCSTLMSFAAEDDDTVDEESDENETMNELVEATWWHDNNEVKVWCTLNNTPTALLWQEGSWQVQLSLPSEYFALQTVLTFLDVNQKRFREAIATFRPQIQQTQQDVYHNVTNAGTIRNLERRLNHVARTYVRL